MNNNHSTLIITLRLIIGVLFIFSGVSKLYPIEAFEKQLFDLGFASWATAPYMSRGIIILEIFLGAAFFQKNYLKRIIIPATFLLLVAFCMHLGMTIAKYGANSGNCGCFGQLIKMTPLEALIKNILTLGLLGYLYKKVSDPYKQNLSTPFIIYLLSALSIFVAFPVKTYTTDFQEESVAINEITPDSNSTLVDTTTKAIATVDNKAPDQQIKLDPKKNQQTNTDPIKLTPVDTAKKQTVTVKNEPTKTTSIFASYRNFSGGVTTNLDEGKKIVTLFSLECEHCMETAKKIGELSNKMTIPPTFYLFWGTEDQLDGFYAVAKKRFPHKILEPQVFFPLLGKAPSPPRVVVLHNGNIIADYDSDSFSLEKLEEVLKK